MYEFLPAVVEGIIEETPTIKSFILKPKKDFSFETGQFIELGIEGFGEAPFTPSSDPSVNDRLEVSVMNVGRLSSRLHEIKDNIKVGIRGPYGNGYPLDKFRGKDILIVGGGVGLAPLRSLVFSLLSARKKFKKILLRYGARTPQDTLYPELLSQWSKKIDLLNTVDVANKGYKGKVGLVTTILKSFSINLKNAICVVCGPPIMMKFSTLRLLELGFKPENIYLSMERNMSCGLGKCGHCRIGKYYVCKDGPVFTFEQLKDIPDIWD